MDCRKNQALCNSKPGKIKVPNLAKVVQKPIITVPFCNTVWASYPAVANIRCDTLLLASSKGLRQSLHEKKLWHQGLWR